jgi:hypothetical protein
MPALVSFFRTHIRFPIIGGQAGPASVGGTMQAPAAPPWRRISGRLRAHRPGARRFADTRHGHSRLEQRFRAYPGERVYGLGAAHARPAGFWQSELRYRNPVRPVVPPGRVRFSG